MKKLIASLLLAATIITPAVAANTYRITDDFGGSIIEYIQKYRMLGQAGGKIEIDGFCLSACTLVLGTMDFEDVCVTDKAIFGFHSASGQFGEFSSEGTRLMWQTYPKWVQDILREHGWDAENPEKAEHPNLIYFSGSTFYDYCPGDEPKVSSKKAEDKAFEELSKTLTDIAEDVYTHQGNHAN